MKVLQGARRAQLHEQDLLADFCAEAFHASPEYFLRRWRLDPAEESFGVVLEDDGEVVAYLHVYERMLRAGLRTVRTAGLGNVAVSNRHRGRGYSIQLLESALLDAEADGFDISLLYTHIPGLYERVGFRNLPFHEVDMKPGTGDGWFIGDEPTPFERSRYAAEHGFRPGAVERTPDYWDKRDQWLRSEGWRVFRHRDEDGYCYAMLTPAGGLVDEAVGGIVRRLEREAPRAGAWRRRLPNSAGATLGITPSSHSFIMARPLNGSTALENVSWADGVFWQTDSF